MANKRIHELTDNGSYDGDLYVEVDKSSFPESQKQLVSVVISDEASSRSSQDDVIEAGAGLETDGTYSPDATTNYLKAADFVAAGLSESLKDADKLLDTQVKVNTDAISALNTLTTTIITVPSPSPRALNSAPYDLIGTVTEDLWVYRCVVAAFAELDYGTAKLEVGSDTLDLRYSDGTVIGTWTNGFIESVADTRQRCNLADNPDIPTTGSIQLYCGSDAGGASTSSIKITIVYSSISL